MLGLKIPTLGDRRRLRSLLSSATGLATVALVGGKIAGIVTLPWWLVFGPLWMPFVFVLALLVLTPLGQFIINMLELGAHDDTEDDDDDFWSPRDPQ